MTELKPYKKEKEGKLQRLPVKHVNQYNIHNEEELITIKPKTHVIIHGSRLEEVPLKMVKKATMDTNPFIAKMRENAKAAEEKE